VFYYVTVTNENTCTRDARGRPDGILRGLYGLRAAPYGRTGRACNCSRRRLAWERSGRRAAGTGTGTSPPPCERHSFTELRARTD